MNKKLWGLLLISLAMLTLLGCPPKTPPPPPSPSPAPAPSPAAPLTREQATKILLDEVVKPDTLKVPLIAFGMDQPLPAGAQVAPYAPDPLPVKADKLPYLVPETLAAPAWFFWVDDGPFTRFSHPTRYVYVDAGSGKVRVVKQAWWPYINGVAQWVDFDQYWNRQSWAYSNIPDEAIPPRPTASLFNPFSSGLVVTSLTRALQPDWRLPPALPDGEAMVVVNGFKAGQNDAGFADDVVNATQFGGNAQIPKYQPQGNTKADVEDAIRRARDDGATDIFFYYTGHGGHSDTYGSYMAYKDDAIWADDFAKMLQKYCTVRFKVVIDACHSGGFADEMKKSGKVDVFQSAAGVNESSYGDYDPISRGIFWDDFDYEADPNADTDKGGEYSSGFWEDMEEINNSEELQEEARRIAREKNVPELAGRIALANKSALEKDYFALNGRTHPVSWVENTTPPVTTPPVTPPPVTEPPVEQLIGIEYKPDYYWTYPDDVFDSANVSTDMDLQVSVLDLTGGDYPITGVTVKLGGYLVLDSGGISLLEYTGTTPKIEVKPGDTVDIEIVALNLAGSLTAGETITVPEPPEPVIKTGQLSIPLGMSAESVGTETECTSSVTVSYSATLSGDFNITVTRVVLKVNGEVWADSGAIATDNYHNSVGRSGLSCGQTFNAEVIVTTSDGETHSNSGSITTPVPSAG
ncbi:MAG: C13 family peptidase [Chloroflexota bacterium]